MLIDDGAFASTSTLIRPPAAQTSPARPSAGAASGAGLPALLGRDAALRLALELAREDAALPCLETPMPGAARARLASRDVAAAALGLIVDPAAIVEPTGEIAMANAAFLAIAARLRPVVAAQLLAARGAGGAHPRGHAAGVAEMRFWAVEGGVLILFPLRADDGVEGGALAVLRAPKAGERCCDPALLEQAFALTPAEARLACALMRTKSLPAAIRELGLKDKTGRTYLDRIFQKTGARSQLQLYAILIELYLMATPGA